MNENKYQFNRESFDRLIDQLHGSEDIRERLSAMPDRMNIRIQDKKQAIDRIMDAVAGFDAVNEAVSDSNIDEALDCILNNDATGLAPDEVLRRLDCALDVFTSPVKLQLFEDGMTDTEFFNKYNELHGDAIPAEALRESVKNSINKLDISASQLYHTFFSAYNENSTYENAFNLARDNFNTKCTVAMHIYLENTDLSPEAAAVIACTQLHISNITYAKHRGDIFEKYSDYLMKAVILAALITIIALSIHYGGFVALFAALGKYIASTFGITICTSVITGLSAYSGLICLLMGITVLQKKLGKRVARDTYFDLCAIDDIETVEAETASETAESSINARSNCEAEKEPQHILNKQ